MSTLIREQQRPSGNRLLGNHEARIRALEARLLNGFLRYKHQNVGEWLYIEATGGDPLTHTNGIFVVAPHGVRFDIGLMEWNLTDVWLLNMDDGLGIQWDIGPTSSFRYDGGDVSFNGNNTSFDVATNGGDIRLLSENGELADLQLNGNGSVELSASDTVLVQADDDVAIRAWSDTLGLDLRDSTGVFLFAGGRPIVIDAGTTGTGSVSIRIASGQDFTVLDSGGNPMLQMTDGSADLHIPSGGGIVADL